MKAMYQWMSRVDPIMNYNGPRDMTVPLVPLQIVKRRNFDEKVMKALEMVENAMRRK
jgi:hypothetical protein